MYLWKVYDSAVNDFVSMSVLNSFDFFVCRHWYWHIFWRCFSAFYVFTLLFMIILEFEKSVVFTVMLVGSYMM